MPELDYMVVADYVRQDGNVVHIMGAGVDTVFAPVVPTVQPFGIALRLTFGAEEEVGASHYLKITFQSADGEQLLVARSVFNTPPPKPGVPEHWRTAMGLAIQIPVPLPRYGDYSFELDIDDGAITKSIDVRAVRPGQDQN
jgi:hypothetical protein